MVGHEILDLGIMVRVHARQPIQIKYVGTFYSADLSN